MSEEGKARIAELSLATQGAAGDGQGGEGEAPRSKIRTAAGWLHNHYVAPLIVLILGAAVLIWIGLVP